MNHTLLQTRYDEANASDEQFLAAYNAATIKNAVPVLVADFAQHVEKDIVPTLLASLEHPDVSGALRVCVLWALRLPQSQFADFSMESPSFQLGLAQLEHHGLLSSEQVDGMLALGFKFVSQSFLDHGRETTQLDLDVMRNQPAIVSTQQIISDAEALDSELTQAEYSRQSARQNELTALRLVLAELESGVVRDAPEAPSGEAWE